MLAVKYVTTKGGGTGFITELKINKMGDKWNLISSTKHIIIYNS